MKRPPHPTLIILACLLMSLSLSTSAAIPGLGPELTHSKGVSKVGFDIKQRYALTVEYNTFHVWDIDSGKELWRKNGDLNGQAIFSPDGEYVYSVAYRTVRCWRSADGTLVREFDPHPSGIRFISLSADSRLLFSAGEEGDARISATATGKSLVDFKAGGNSLTDWPEAGFSDDSHHLLVRDATGIRVHDVATARVLWEVPKAGSAAFLSKDEVLVSRWSDEIEIHNSNTGKVVRTLKTRHGIEARRISVHPESGSALLIGADKAILIDTNTGIIRKQLVSSGGNAFNFITYGLISADGQHIAIAFSSGELQTWSIGDEQPQRITSHTKSVEDIAFSPDSKYLLSGSEDTTARLWDVVSASAPAAAAPTEIFIKPVLPRLVTRQGHANNISVYAISRDGQHLITGAKDNQVSVWHIKTGREVQKFDSHAAPVTALAISHNNKLLASGDEKGIVTVHDLDTGERTQRIAYDGNVSALQFLPGDTKIVIGHNHKFGTGGGAAVYLLDSGRKESDIGQLYGKGARQVLLTPGNKHLAIISKDSSLLFSLDNLKEPITTLSGPHTQYLVSGCFTPDGTQLIVVDYESTMVVFDVTTGKVLRHWKAHNYATQAIMALDNKTVVSASYSHIRSWDISTGKRLQNLKSGEVLSGTIALLPEGEAGNLLAGHEHGVIKHANLRTGKYTREWHTFGLTGSINSVAFSADGTRIVIAGDGYENQNLVQVWSLETGKETHRISGRKVADYDPNRGPLADGNMQVLKTRAAFLPDNRLLIRNSRYARVHDLATGNEVFLQDDKSNRIYFGSNAIAVSPSGKSVLFTDQVFPGQWDVKTGKRTRDLIWKYKNAPFIAKALNFAFSPDGKTIIATSNSSTQFAVMEADSGKVLRVFGEHIPLVSSIAYSPDSRFIYSGNFNNGDVTIWDINTGILVATLTGHIDAVMALSFHPNGKQLLTASRDGTVRLWDVNTRKELQRFDAQSQAVTSVAFSPNGQLFASGHADGATVIWDISKPDWQAKLFSFRNNNWLVTTTEGRYDTNSPGDLPAVSWVVDDKPRTPVPVEVFIREFYEPRLLPRLLANARFRPIRRIRDINRVQPEVNIVAVVADKQDPSIVNVRISVKQGKNTFSRQGKTVAIVSGAQDLRLFRDGQLVGYAPQQPGGLILDKTSHATTLLLKGIRLPTSKAGKTINLSAYAFNDNGIKSETARYVYNVPDNIPKHNARAYIISIGMNSYENPAWDLRYAANDAMAMQDIVTAKLLSTGRYSDVVTIPFVSEKDKQDPKITKKLLLAVFDLLAGRDVPVALRNQIPMANKIKRARPEDLVFISYSGHGYAHWDGTFYMFPYDIGNNGKREMNQATLDRLLSSDTLADTMRDIDAGEFIMIIDACNSAASVQGDNFKPGPMGSRGLGQLAFNKGMRVLTASQSESLALESELLQHGLLSYVLLREGIESRQADYNPADKQVTVSEWLGFGQKRVPEMFVELVNNTFSSKGKNAPKFRAGDEQGIAAALRDVQLPGLFDFGQSDRNTVLFNLEQGIP